MKRRLSPAARRSIRRMMRRRPGCKGCPLPRPGGTTAFDAWEFEGAWFCGGPAVGAVYGAYVPAKAATRSQAIREAGAPKARRLRLVTSR